MEMNKEEAAEALATIDPGMIALAAAVTHAAEQYVYGLVDLMNFVGAPMEFAVPRIIDTVLLKVENAYGPLSREDWLSIYDEAAQFKNFITENPELTEPVRAQIAAHQAQAEVPAPVEPDETRAEKANRRAFGIDLSDLDNL